MRRLHFALRHKSHFKKVFKNNSFNGIESLSGRGSDSDQSSFLVSVLPNFFSDTKITSIFDVPCGDHEWFKKIDLADISYTGADIVPQLIDANNIKFASEHKKFISFDLTKQIPPKSDLIFCRDLFVHLDTKSIFKSLKNIKDSGSKFLLTTTFAEDRLYSNIAWVSLGVPWRAINLQNKPFNFPDPIHLINEKCTEGDGLFHDKSLGLWSVQDLEID
jgi:hypothetical protein